VSGEDDWAPGDLAWCVAVPDSEPAPSLRIGALYTVMDIWEGPDQFGELGLALELREARPSLDGYDGYDPEGFVKLSDHTPDAEDVETIRLLTGKPVKVAA
jgi:hypothetical protein